MTNLQSFLDSLPPLDWQSDGIYLETSEILNRIAADPVALGKLVSTAAKSHELFSQFECHAQFDRFVLYDALKTKAFRLRLHIWHENDFDLPHQHRYAFTTKILRGGYHHIIYSADPRIAKTPTRSVDARPYQVELEAQPRDVIAPDLAPAKQFECVHREGDCYMLRPELFHSSRSTRGNISLFIRGPATQKSALELESRTGKLYSRNSREVESSAQRLDVKMSDEMFRKYCAGLSAKGVISQ